MGLIKHLESFQRSDQPIDSDVLSEAAHKQVTGYVNKDKRILVQGLLQAVLQSQGLLLEPHDGYINKVKEVTLDLVKFVEEHSK